MHLLFVLAAANLYAQMHGLPGSQDQTALKDLLQLLPLPDPQYLAPIFASDLELTLASAEFGEVPGPRSPKLPHKGLTLSLACAAERGPAANSRPLRPSDLPFL